MKKRMWIAGLLVFVALVPGVYAYEGTGATTFGALAPAVPVFAGEGLPTTIGLSSSEDLGQFLVDANGMTLYTFTKDEPGTSNCYGQCAVNWPPLTVAEGETPTAAVGIDGTLGVTVRTDGVRQVTYNGWPLYGWIKDVLPGDTTGQGVNDAWAVVRPRATVEVGGSAALGQFLVDARGMTLYLFTKDEPDQSNCSGQCAVNWPPLTVEAASVPSAGPGATGLLGLIQRNDGIQQVTYNGWPLYGWIKDQTPGDTTGQGVNDAWFVVQPWHPE